MNSHSRVRASLAPWWRFALGCGLPLLLLAANSVRVLKGGATPFDTDHTYLPLARLLLADPIAFLTSPESVMVAPGTYLYMALFGVRIEVIQWIDVVLAMAALLLLADAARRTGGWLAGAAAAWLFALSPLLARYMIPPQSEPPFLFLAALWLWCMGWLLAPGRHDASPDLPAQPKTMAIVLLGGLALAGATLTRGTWLYWIALAMLACSWLAWRGRGVVQTHARQLLAVHLIALTLVGGVMLRNLVMFDRAIIATGAGQALYLGSNAVLGGYEPPWFGLLYDDSTVTGGDFQQLTLEGDRRLFRVARAMLADTPWPTLLQMAAKKAGAMLWFSKAHLEDAVWNDRAWRIVLLVLAVFGGWKFRRIGFAEMLVAALGYQWVVHWPVLYNPRYAVGALELPLTVLASLGVAGLSAGRWRLRSVVMVSAVGALGIAVGAWHQRYGRPVLPQLERGPHLLLARVAPENVEFQNLSGSPFGHSAATGGDSAALIWRNVDLTQGERAIVWLDVRTLDARCTALEVRFDGARGEQTRQRVSIRGRGEHDDIGFGIAALLSGIESRRGALRIGLVCPAGARLQLDGLALYRVSMGLHYAPALFGWGQPE